MSELSDINARPAKRARLDEPAATADALPKAPIVSDTPTSTNEHDLEREVRAGIAEYVCPDNLGFTGVLKQRYTDFLVNEIGLDGEVLHLRKAGVEGKPEKHEEAVVAKENANGNPKRKVEALEESGPVAKLKLEESVVQETTVGSGTGALQENGAARPSAEAGNGTVNIAPTSEEAAEPPKEEESFEVPEADLATLNTIFGEDTTKEIVALVRAIRRKEDRKAKDFRAVIAPPITDKDIRTRAHQSLRQIFPNLLESSMEADQSLRIKAVPPKERKGKNKKERGDRGNNNRENGPDRRKGQLAWEELGGEYLHFTLYKENKDTMEVIGFLGSKLGGGKNPFSFAGTKDRRACTVQRVCVKRQTAERINHFNKMLFSAAVGDYSYEKRDLGLGDLKGNEFVITLRDCHFQSEEGLDLEQRVKLANDIVAKAITDFSKEGFINYYGLQRFGSFAASTDTVGLKMLQNNLKGAVEDLLAYSDTALAAAEGRSEDPSIMISQDDRNRAKALHIWKTTGKGGPALEILPYKFKAERSIVQHLSSRNSKSGRYDRTSDWQGALQIIPRQLRLMYVHAYQSLVWNTVAGKRWSTHGSKVVEGDLVLVHEHKDKEANAEVAAKDSIDQDGEIVINPAGDDSALAAEEAASGQYTIFDIVLPQPGFDVEYPKNEIGKFYEEFMGSERGGGLNPHKMRRPWREVSLSGGYRKFLARPLKPLEYSVHSYTRPEEQFVETDLQKVRKDEGKEEAQNGDDVEMADEAAKKIAVVIKLQLGSSQYATMALRELMKAGGVKAFKPEFMGGR